MYINLTKPLQILQWLVYVCLVVLVKVFIILPIAVLLFNDFYLRLLPADSSQWVTLSKLHADDYGQGIELSQTIERIPIEREIPVLLDNGIPESIPLRDHIAYKMDLDMSFFCINSPNNQGYSPPSMSELVLEIHSPARKNSLLYKRRVPVLCMSIGDSIVEEEIYRQGSSRFGLYEKEWINRITINDKIDIGPNDSELKYISMIETHDPKILFTPESGFRLRMNFEQGLRNLMLRWHKITYIVGIIVFDCAISSIFIIAVISTFYSLSNKLNRGIKKD